MITGRILQRAHHWLGILTMLLIHTAVGQIEKEREHRPEEARRIGRLLEREQPRLVGRLLLGGRYRPHRDPRDRFEGLSPESLLRLSEAKGLISKLDETAPKSDLHKACIHLLLNLKEGIQRLEKAAKIHSDDIEIWNALSVAYLEDHFRNPRPFNTPATQEGDKKEEGSRNSSLLSALETVDKAVAIDLARPEPRFNRALILEELTLYQEALKEWESYLSLETDNAWIEDRQPRVAKLRDTRPRERLSLENELRAWADLGRMEFVEEKVRAAPNRSRELAQKFLFYEWARDENGERHEDARDRLGLLLGIGSSLAGPNGRGDPFILDSARALRIADGKDLRFLIEAHLAYGEGMESLEAPSPEMESSWERNLERARAKLSKSLQLFQLRSPFRLAAELGLAEVSYKLLRGKEEYGPLLQRLQEVSREADDRSYLSVKGRSEYLHGLYEGVRGNFENSHRNYLNALLTFERLGEPRHVIRVKTAIAEVLRFSGKYENAWDVIFDVLRVVPTSRNPGLRWHFYSELAAQVLAKDIWSSEVRHKLAVGSRSKRDSARSALHIYNEALFWAELSGIPAKLAETYRRRSEVQQLVGNPAQAKEDLQKAEAASRRLWTGSSVRDDVQTTGAKIGAAENPEAALDTLAKTKAVHDESGYAVRSLAIRREMARLHRELGDNQSAESALESAIRIIELQRGNILDVGRRLTFLRPAEAVFDAMVSLQAVDLGNPLKAFHYSDCSRARVLNERWDPESSCLVPPTRHSPAEIPRRVVVVEYKVLKERTLIWILRPGRHAGKVDLQMIDLPRGDLELGNLTSEFLESIRYTESASRFLEVSGELHDTLVGGIRGLLNHEAHLVIVPDKSLHALPFAALYNRKTGRFLIENHPMSVAPSVGSFQRLRREWSPLPEDPRVLVVGAPSFDPSLFPDLAPLGGALQEAEQIEDLYPQAVALKESKATVGEFLKQAPKFSIVHIAAHAVIDTRNPLLSSLIFSTTKQGSGRLTVERLYDVDFEETQFVILSACSTGRGREYFGEGPISLARPFLDKGVAAVLAGLWPVEDQAARRILVDFHTRLSKGADPVTALRDAQIAEIRDGSPKDWAAFGIIGGVAVRPVN